MPVLILTLLICLSCTKHAEVTKDAVGVQIRPVQMEVSRLNEITWNIGQKKEATVSQSITFIVNLPKISVSDLEYLTVQKGIDSWILRLIVERGSVSQDLGSLFTVFKPKTTSRGAHSSGTITSVTIKIFYAAAFASDRFRAFKCPAFEHNKKLSKKSIKGENEQFTLTIDQISSYAEKSNAAELTPSSFNAGNSLVGDYFIEIAPYDSVNKHIHAAFKRIPMYVSLEKEESVRVKSCDGIHEEFQP